MIIRLQTYEQIVLFVVFYADQSVDKRLKIKSMFIFRLDLHQTPMYMPELSFAPRPISRGIRLRSLKDALLELQKLQQAPRILLSPGWNLPHILDHCSRSIEHAMQGFPEQKNVLFQTLIGATAFHLFDARGYMTHDLSEEIPGSHFEAEPSLEEAIQKLQQSIQAFIEYKGDMNPHFAYGKLSKSQHERANAMHIANHLDAMEY